MLQSVEERFDVGVVIARFQVHELHDAHMDLLEHVCANHEKVLVLLGISPLPVSSRNPLDFEARKQMILAAFPNVTCLYVRDQPLDAVWSRKVDSIVDDFLTPGQTAILYGSRDSFIAHYGGKRPCRELLSETVMSGDEVRRDIARSSTRSSPDFRAGVIWASTARFPTVFTTVDVAILNEDGGKVLLGRKKNEVLFRFIGGFADPGSNSFAQDARREVQEEAGVAIGDLRIIGSTLVDDWRYRHEPDSIKTLLFTAKYTHGRPTPGDDIHEVRWFDLRPGTAELIVPTHRPLMAMLLDHLEG